MPSGWYWHLLNHPSVLRTLCRRQRASPTTPTAASRPAPCEWPCDKLVLAAGGFEWFEGGRGGNSTIRICPGTAMYALEPQPVSPRPHAPAAAACCVARWSMQTRWATRASLAMVRVVAGDDMSIASVAHSASHSLFIHFWSACGMTQALLTSPFLALTATPNLALSPCRRRAVDDSGARRDPQRDAGGHFRRPAR